MIAWLVGAAALAASWSVALPLERAVGPDGLLEVPAGRAVQVLWPPDLPPPVIRDPQGRSLHLRGTPGGLLLPADGVGRLLRVEGEGVRVRLQESRGDAARWEAWEAAARRALRRDPTAVPPAPWGGVEAEVRLRARATGHRGVAVLGLVHDAALVRPGGMPAHRPAGLHAGEVVSVRGPGLALVRITPVEEGLQRFHLEARLGGERVLHEPVAASQGVTRTLRVWIPPGEHGLALSTDPAPTEIEIDLRRHRPPVGGARGVGRAEGLAEAERLWLLGRREAALPLFRAALGGEGPAEALARARLIAGSTEVDEVRELALRPLPDDPDARAVLATALVSRGDLLPPELVGRAIEAAPRPPAVEPVARWLHGLGGLRPAGQALLWAASPTVGDGPHPALAATRESARALRATVLEPEGEGGERVIRDAVGPGVPRVRLQAGEAATVHHPHRGDGRVHLLRLEAEGPTVLRLGERTLVTPGGRLDHGLMGGEHRVSVESGAVVLMDAEGVEGGQAVRERRLRDLPAAWALPEPGLPVDLVVETHPPAPLLATFDDGRVVALPAPVDGEPAVVRAGPWAAHLALQGPDGVQAVVMARAVHLPMPPPAALPTLPLDETLLGLEQATRRVDAGEDEARLERAALLASLAFRTPARQDLAAAWAHPELRGEIRALLAAIRVAPPVVHAEGPWTVPAWLAASGLDAPEPTGAPDERARALEALAEAHGSAALHALAARAWVEAEAWPQAAEAAARAGPDGEALLESLKVRHRWRPVARVDRSAGLGTVAMGVEAPGPEAPLGRRVAAALLAPPWSLSEAVVLREGALEARLAEAATLEVFCRDETLAQRPCAVPLRVGGERLGLEVACGQVVTVTVDGAPRLQEVEVGAPARGQAVVLRLAREGETLPIRFQVGAVYVAPGQPVRATVAGEALLRVQVLEGQVRVWAAGREVEAREGEQALFGLLEQGPQPVIIEGRGAVRLLRADRLHTEAPPEAPPEPGVGGPDPALISGVLARYAHPPEALLRAPGSGGTTRVRLSAVRRWLAFHQRPWLAGEAWVGWSRRDGPRFVHLEAWGRGPGLSAGGGFEGGHTWQGGVAHLGLSGATSGFTDRGDGHVRLDARARHDLSLGGGVDLRAVGAAWAGWYAPGSALAVDPAVWTRFQAQRPLGVSGRLGVVVAPWRDLRLQTGLHAATNPDLSLERLGGQASADLLLAGDTLLGLDAALAWRFADRHRPTGFSWPVLGAKVDRATWLGPNRRLSTWVRLQARSWSLHLDGQVGITLLGNAGRGLRDLRPDEELFRTVREAP